MVSGFKGFLFLLVIACFMGCTGKQNSAFNPENLNVIPKPHSIKLDLGQFEFNEGTVLVGADSLSGTVRFFQELLSHSSGYSLELQQQTPQDNYIIFLADASLGPESYALEVNSSYIQIKASAKAGYGYALQTLRQLLPNSVESQDAEELVVPALKIEDEPLYAWRGLMLDVSRHFFETEYILKTIDRLAFLKFNTLHLHLIDNQGWRIEIKRYPKLTEKGAYRIDQENKHWNAREVNDPDETGTYGGFYTQEDIKKIVSYAKDRGIQVVPEIEMPAHVMSAIAAYPFLSCTQEPIAVPSGGVWPITEIYCPGKETTFEFLENVLDEIMPLFPSKYVHVGGDEATKSNWETCPDCQHRIAEEHLEGTEELQSYFMKRIERFLAENGKVLIGWDEILEGGLPPAATVMSWRGTKGGWEASESGHDVVMTPENPMYFNFYQGNPDVEPLAFDAVNTLEQVYAFDPVLDSMSTAQKQHILGGQANLWSEYITSPDASEYMLFPRLTALAEVLWSKRESKNWKNYTERLKYFMPRLEVMDINFSRSIYNVEVEARQDSLFGGIQIDLSTEMPDAAIHYVLGNAPLDEQANLFAEAIQIDTTTHLKAAVFENGKPAGRILDKSFDFHKAVGQTLTFNNAPHPAYNSGGAATLVNVLRGSKNFHDGQWLGWLNTPVEILLDLGEINSVSEVQLGTLENQGAGIYYPIEVEIFSSNDGKQFKTAGSFQREFKANGSSSLDTFKVSIQSKEIRYLKVRITPYSAQGKGVWTFIDELLVK